MLTQVDLQAIGKLIDTRIEPLQAGINTLTAGQLRLEKIQQAQGKQIEAQGKKLDTLDKKIDQGITDLIDLFHETWKHYDKQGAELKAEIQSERFKRHEERVAELIQLKERVTKLEQQQASDKS